MFIQKSPRVWHTRFPSGWLPEQCAYMVDRHNWQHIVRLGFLSVQLYADVTLQLFFIVTSIMAGSTG